MQIEYTHPDGRAQHVFKTSPVQTRRGAEEYERQIRAALLAGTYLAGEEVQKEQPTLTTFLDERWLKTYPEAAGHREKTKAATAWALGHVRPFLGERKLTEIGPEALAELVAELRAKKLSEKSVKAILGQLHRVLTVAEEWGVLPSVPRFPRIKAPDRGFDHLSREESRTLVAAAQPDEDAPLLFALHTGARLGELLALTWSDIDWHRREVIIRRNRPSGTKTVGPTKSSKERRVPMTGELEATLQRHRHLRGPLVFCQADGSSLEPWHLHHLLDRSRKRAALRSIRWHDLRHSFASQAVAAGVPLNVVQAWLGHSTIMMTMRYAHLAPDGGAEWIRALEGASSNRTVMKGEREAN